MEISNPSAAVARRAFLTVALCCLVAAMEGIDLQAPGLTVPILGPLFKMSAVDKGWFLSISTFGLMAGAAVGGRLSDRIGRKWVLILAAALFGLFSTATAFATSAHMLLLARLMTGVGLGGALPNVIALTAENVSYAKRHTAVGFLYASLPAGGGLAGLITALTARPDQWPVIYLVGGIVPLAAVPLLAIALPGRTPAPPAAAETATPIAARGILTALFGEGRAARTLLLWVGFFCALLILYLLLGWLPSLMISRGLTRPQASTVQMAFNLCGALGSIVTGLALDRGRRPITITAVFASTALALGYLASVPAEVGLAVLAGALAGACMGGCQSTLYSLAPSCYPDAVRGTGVGSTLAVGRFGSACGPLLAGFLVGAGRSPAQVLMALIPIIAISAIAAVLVSILASKPADAS
jgi:AAHS family 3-hydroxyphenylpropionic acid transporter